MDPTERTGAALPDCEGACPGESVATRAYRLYLSRGSTAGHDVRDWLEAEAQLLAEQQAIGNRPEFGL